MEVKSFWIFLIIVLIVGVMIGFLLGKASITGNAISKWSLFSSSSSGGASPATNATTTGCGNMECPDPRYLCSMINGECKCTQGASPGTAPAYIKCVPKKSEDCCSLVNGNCTGKCPNGKSCQQICSCLNSTTAPSI